jgi:hypothetical protein
LKYGERFAEIIEKYETGYELAYKLDMLRAFSVFFNEPDDICRHPFNAQKRKKKYHPKKIKLFDRSAVWCQN